MWIRTTLLLITVAACGIGCKYDDVELLGDGGGTCTKCPALPDLATPPAKCAAAKGLPGVNLFCVDFSQVSSPPSIPSWDFTTIGGNCWQVMGGKLQVNTANFAAYSGTCGFIMPTVLASDYQKYSGFTLSILHRIDISESSSQKIQVMLGADDPLMRLVTQWTGKQARQQSIMTMSKNDLPNAGTSMYQPLFKLSAPLTAGGTAQGWVIESIAVNGVQ